MFNYGHHNAMRLFLSLIAAIGLLSTMSHADDHQHGDHDHSHDHSHDHAHSHDHECALDFKVTNIKGETEDLEDYEGKVVLIVNVASRCGYTKQYEGLQSMYEKYQDKGLVILGFPCNQFGGQEPGTSEQILEFCTSKFNVSFPMFEKIDVKGDDAAPIYKYLSSKEIGPKEAGDVSWNFEKFLIDREGNLVKRFQNKVAPGDEELTNAVESLL